VIGDAVNLASRLEAMAPPGGVALGARTASLLDGAELESLGAVAVKGKREPVEVLLLGGLR
jgi:class 3 adenylate cyclase